MEALINFLKNHHEFNRTLQNRFYCNKLKLLADDYVQGQQTNELRLACLLHATVHTQARANLDNLANFFINLHANLDRVGSLAGFVNHLNKMSKVQKKNNDPVNLNDLFNALKRQDGWGEKTAALFVKACCNIHWDDANQDLRFWDDFPKKDNCGQIYLPVDSVIRHIFSKLNVTNNLSFSTINNYVNEQNIETILLLDNLWFWGFITQRKTKNGRNCEWNPGKYYALEYTDKNPEYVETVRDSAKKFISILKAKKLI